MESLNHAKAVETDLERSTGLEAAAQLQLERAGSGRSPSRNPRLNEVEALGMAERRRSAAPYRARLRIGQRDRRASALGHDDTPFAIAGGKNHIY
jgi:hypothetical protein